MERPSCYDARKVARRLSGMVSVALRKKERETKVRRKANESAAAVEEEEEEGQRLPQ